MLNYFDINQGKVRSEIWSKCFKSPLQIVATCKVKKVGRRGGGGKGDFMRINILCWLFLQELEVTAKILLAKGGETSGFIRDDVEKALTAMVCSLTPTRVLCSLISGGARSVPMHV